MFNYTDHFGNIRLSYALDPSGEGLKVMEENHYYPFGLKHTYNSDRRGIEFEEFELDPTQQTRGIIMVNNNGYQYKYNGFEFQDELGLNLYDYGARNYDPAIGRWMNMDPLAENSRRWTPYNYCYNNPVYFIDPDGMQAKGFEDIEKQNNSLSPDKISNTIASTVVDNSGRIIDHKDDGDDNIYLNTRSEENIIGKEKNDRTYIEGNHIYRDEITVNIDQLPKHFWNIIYAAEIMNKNPPEFIHPKDVVKTSVFKLLFSKKALITFGKNSNQIHHTFRHILEAGLNKEAVTKAVTKSVNKNLSKINTGKTFNKTITVGRQKITYSAHKLPSGEINVGRIVIPKI